ncbi:MAG: L,D-transpeptidase [Actinobacteria bacterium]|nr:L,D-transpeptidase [Actinomycetota bacterium]
MRLRIVMLAVVAAGVLVGGAIGFGVRSGPSPVSGQAALGVAPAGGAQLVGTWVPAKPKPKHPSSFTVADAKGPSVDLYSAPDVPLRTMQNPTWEGLAVVFLVLERKGDWLHVRVSSRPNSMTAWIRTSQVSLRTVPNWVRIEIAAKRATVYNADTPLFSTVVATGRSSAPTPVGSFFVDGVVLLSDTSGPYGVAQVSVSGFSDVYQSFGGGTGQIAMHGTNNPALLGQGVSNGCVRMANDSILAMVRLAPTGTPVEIVP